MKSLLDNSSIELTCPECSHKFKERLGKLKTNPTVPCPHCGTGIAVNADQLVPAMDKVDKAAADFLKAASRLGKKR